MSEMIRCLALGSCGVQSAQRLLTAEGFLLDPYALLGFRWRPFVFSSGAALQLYDFCVGERLPPEVIRLAYKEPHQPTSETRDAIDENEIVLVELSTPREPTIDGHAVNLNNINNLIVKALRKSSVDVKVVVGWASSLYKASEDLKAKADVLLQNWPDDIDDDGLARFGVENLSVRRLSVDDMVRDLERLRDRLARPMALQLYTFRYMPDGRAIDWPAGFAAQQIEVARRLDLPTLDLAPLVSRLGPQRLITDDMYHWRAETRPLRAEVTYDFLARILGRPGLEAYPRSQGIRRDVRAAFPEFSDAPVSLVGGAAVGAPSNVAAVSRPAAPVDGAHGARPVLLEGDQLADRLNGELIALHKRHLESLDSESRRFWRRYRPLLERGALVGYREATVLELIDLELDDYDAYAVMRAGLGELALLIAASGRQVVAYEPNRHGRAAIEAGASHLESLGLLNPGALVLIDTLTPRYPVGGRVLGIGLKDGPLPSDEASHFERAAQFDALLIDLRLFLRRREDPADQALAAEMLRSLGFDDRRDYQDEDLSWFGRSGAAAAP